MTSPQPRVGAGVPQGGEFSARHHDEATVELMAEQVPDSEESEHYRPRHRILLSALPDFKNRVEKANARLARAGIEERFSYEIERDVLERDGQSWPVAKITMSTPTISAGEWSFTGKHTVTPDGSIVSYSDSGVTVADMHCDHCGSNRKRGAIYTVRANDGTTKQIGSNCLQLFLGVRPEGLWALDADLVLDTAEDEADDDQMDSFRGGRDHWVTPAEDLLAMAIAITDGNPSNFVSKANATMETPSTSSRLFAERGVLISTITDEQRASARELLDWAAALTDEQVRGESYLANLRAIVGGRDKWVDDQHVGIAVSLIAAKNRAEQQIIWEAERAERDRLRELAKAGLAKSYLAEPGEKIADVEARVLQTRYIPSEFRNRPGSTLVKLQTADGHLITWFATGDKDYKDGATVHVKGTVKAHEVYNDEYQTVITRAKISDPDTGDILG